MADRSKAERRTPDEPHAIYELSTKIAHVGGESGGACGAVVCRELDPGLIFNALRAIKGGRGLRRMSEKGQARCIGRGRSTPWSRRGDGPLSARVGQGYAAEEARRSKVRWRGRHLSPPLILQLRLPNKLLPCHRDRLSAKIAATRVGLRYFCWTEPQTRLKPVFVTVQLAAMCCLLLRCVSTYTAQGTSIGRTIIE